MADLPSPIPTVLVATNVVLVLLAAGVLGAFIWMIRGELPRELRSRYSLRTIWMSQLPFTEKWRAAIAPGDLPAFVRRRRGYHLLGLVGVLFMYGVTGYGYVHAVVDLYRCEVSRLDQSLYPPSRVPRSR
jgi:hypothetical protein